MSLVVAVEVTDEVPPLGSVTTDTTLSMKIPRVTGCWLGSFKKTVPGTVLISQTTLSDEAIVHVKVAFSPGQRVTSPAGWSTTEKQDRVYNTYKDYTNWHRSVSPAQSEGHARSSKMTCAVDTILLLSSCVGALNS